MITYITNSMLFAVWLAPMLIYTILFGCENLRIPAEEAGIFAFIDAIHLPFILFFDITKNPILGYLLTVAAFVPAILLGRFLGKRKNTKLKKKALSGV